MMLTMLKSKLHRATVTDANLEYEGSVSICPKLIKAAGFCLFEQVDIYNCNNGARFHTYVILGKEGEICLNGAAARHVHKGDIVIIAAYVGLSEAEADKHQPACVFLTSKNEVKEVRGHG
jgi:aspartate 1-decarboxylase